MVRNFRQPADRDFSMLRFFGLRDCMNYDLGFLCLTRPAFTHLPKIPYAVVLFSTYAVYLEIRICRHLACTFWNVGYFFYILSWHVREITSSCCSLVRSMNLTAYPDTRIVKFAYSSFSGCSIASMSFSLPNTFTLR